MPGWMRFVFYGGMFLLALSHWKSPLQALELYEGTDPALRQTYGLMEFLGIGPAPVEILRVVVWVTGVAWITTAVGFLTRLSSIKLASAPLTGFAAATERETSVNPSS